MGAVMDTFTKEEIDGWINAEGEIAQGRNYAEAFKFGFGQGLVAIRIRMDDEIKRRRASEQMHVDNVDNVKS